MAKNHLQQLYDSSIAYGLKKALVAYQSKTDMHDRIKALKKQNNELRNKIGGLENDEQDIITNHAHQLEEEEKNHQNTRKVFRDQIAVTKVELTKIMSMPF